MASTFSNSTTNANTSTATSTAISNGSDHVFLCALTAATIKLNGINYVL